MATGPRSTPFDNTAALWAPPGRDPGDEPCEAAFGGRPLAHPLPSPCMAGRLPAFRPPAGDVLTRVAVLGVTVTPSAGRFPAGPAAGMPAGALSGVLPAGQRPRLAAGLFRGSEPAEQCDFLSSMNMRCDRGGGCTRIEGLRPPRLLRLAIGRRVQSPGPL